MKCSRCQSQTEFRLKWKTHVNKRQKKRERETENVEKSFLCASNKLCLNGNDVQNKLHLNNKLFAVIIHHYDWVAFTLTVETVAVNICKYSSWEQRREINEKLGDIRCRDQFFITWFFFLCLSRSLSFLCFPASFLFSVYKNMFRYVNHAKVIYKRLLE